MADPPAADRSTVGGGTHYRAALQGTAGTSADLRPLGLRDELLAVEEATEGLRAVVRRHRTMIQRISFNDTVVLVNINTPAD